MYNMMRDLLKKENREIYMKYQLIKSLLYYTAKENSIEMSDKLWIELIKKYMEKDYIPDIPREFSNLQRFYENMIELYKKDKFLAFTFTIDEFWIPLNIKSWILKSKEEILNILISYFNDEFCSERIIFSNEYFKILEINREDCIGRETHPILEEGIGIILLFQGKILYKDGVICKENEYIVRDLSLKTKGYKILSDKLNVVKIIVKDKFIEDFNIKKPEKIINMRISKFNIDFLDILCSEKLKQKKFMLFEIIILFLKFHNLLLSDNKRIAELVSYSNIDIKDIIREIKNILKCDIDTIEETIFEKFEISIFKLNELIYYYFKTTFRKYVLHLKISVVVNKFIREDRSLDMLLTEYNFENSQIFKYTLKKNYGINIRDLQIIKKTKIEKIIPVDFYSLMLRKSSIA